MRPVSGRAFEASLRAPLLEGAVRTALSHIIRAHAADADDGPTRLASLLTPHGKDSPLRMAARTFPALPAFRWNEKGPFPIPLAAGPTGKPGGRESRRPVVPRSRIRRRGPYTGAWIRPGYGPGPEPGAGCWMTQALSKNEAAKRAATARTT